VRPEPGGRRPQLQFRHTNLAPPRSPIAYAWPPGRCPASATATSCGPRASSTSPPRSSAWTRGRAAHSPRPTAGRSLHEQSHGESFFALFMHRFGTNGLYLMDEPEAALSPRRQLEFLVTAARLSQAGVPVRHRDTLADHHGVPPTPASTSWIRTASQRDALHLTDHYLVTRGFLNSSAT